MLPCTIEAAAGRREGRWRQASVASKELCSLVDYGPSSPHCNGGLHGCGAMLLGKAPHWNAIEN